MGVGGVVRVLLLELSAVRLSGARRLGWLFVERLPVAPDFCSSRHSLEDGWCRGYQANEQAVRVRRYGGRSHCEGQSRPKQSSGDWRTRGHRLPHYEAVGPLTTGIVDAVHSHKVGPGRWKGHRSCGSRCRIPGPGRPKHGRLTLPCRGTSTPKLGFRLSHWTSPTFEYPRAMADFADRSQPIVKALAAIARHQGAELDYRVLSQATASLIKTGYDNWDGGTDLYSLILKVPLVLYADIEAHQEALERSILERIKPLVRTEYGNCVSEVVIAPPLDDSDAQGPSAEEPPELLPSFWQADIFGCS